MELVISTEKHPIKLWLKEIDEEALEQARHLANLDFAFRHVALMPDAHTGFGMPIGGVLATKNHVIPNAVGVDIGCGMCAVPSGLREVSPPQLKEIMSGIRKQIPVGMRSHKKMQDMHHMPKWNNLPKIVEQEFDKARTQVGTLGGGNHFIEIQKGSDGFVWIMIHSGSRNLGKTVADFYNKSAKKLNEKWRSPVPKQWDLAFLPLDCEEAKEYIAEMNYCIDFALANRKLMMHFVQDAINEAIGKEVSYGNIINIAHNYASFETHFGEKVLVHRKGATRAFPGETGIIPGSQGTSSYIVEGVGNPESFMSCSHGAGRRLGRRQAQRQLDFSAEVQKLNDKGIIHSIRTQRDLDEAAGAYKDIDEVMMNQSDLVKIKLKLEPLAVVKG
ncbi:RtcB family protein [Natronoflexus pectinivorans]|uniref:3'-phosphate/5'-hydroxy nucleic acid ligase n=1 Tax=Natronoflexus pectinivorans TaxID=682526 RepID=A0A4R2GKU2_9BACT|nr:RtcB family protein [Natronoflexus pectinivorans]TCO09309.1 tRNA-splicing ligase RtcB [Natronoflexus pectinivorans]